MFKIKLLLCTLLNFTYLKIGVGTWSLYQSTNKTLSPIWGEVMLHGKTALSPATAIDDDIGPENKYTILEKYTYYCLECEIKK